MNQPLEASNQAVLGAVVPAAGQSRRMGRPKINLPWGETTVLGQVVHILIEGGVEDLVVVTGDDAPDGADSWSAGHTRHIHLPEAAAGDMLASLRYGLGHLRPEVGAALVMPADMPAVPVENVREIVDAWRTGGHPLVVPSHQMRRGHPWLAARSLWPAIFALASGQTLRDFLNEHAVLIHYVPVASPGMLLDLDTPDDYAGNAP